LFCSIIIRSFNEERHIGRLLDGISKQQSLFEYEVILVDSGSTDATTFIAQNLGAKIINIKSEDFSFGRALNIGCKAAKGDILLFASAHVYPVYTDWLDKMIKPFKDNQVALVYGRQIGNEVTKFSEHQVFAKWFPSKSNYNQPTPFCNNANCAIRKSLWQEQSFDEYLTGLEDLDWAKRIMDKGFKIAYEAEAAIVHVHEETFSKIQNRYRREAIALKQIFPKVHFNFWDFIRLFIGNSLSDMFHALQKKIFFKEFNSIISFRKMQFWGTYLGHKQKGTVNTELKNRFYYPQGFKKSKKETQLIAGKKNIVEYNK
jgi:glycosyltransferase involved in cell wall biosynthesis